VHFDAVVNRQITQTVTRSLETRILWFNRKTKLTKTVQKLYNKFSQTDRGGRSHHRPLNTPLDWVDKCMVDHRCYSANGDRNTGG